MTDEEFTKFNYMASLYRGLILNEFVRLELQMDLCLANYFCGKHTRRHKEFIEIVLTTDKIGTTNKKEVLMNILKMHNKAFMKKYPHIDTDLKKLIKHRNTVAHHVLDSRPDAEEQYLKTKKVFLMRIDPEKRPEMYNEKVVNEIRDLINKYYFAFLKLNGLK